MQTVSSWSNVHEMSNPVTREKNKKKLLWLAPWTFSADNILVIVYFFPITIWHLETICMKCQILFSRKIYENVQIACWNKIQHTTFWNIFLIFPRKQKPVFLGGIISTCHALSTFFTLWANSAGDDKLIFPPKKQVFVFWEKRRKIFQNVVCWILFQQTFWTSSYFS